MKINIFSSKYSIFIIGFVFGTILTILFFTLIREPMTINTIAPNYPKPVASKNSKSDSQIGHGETDVASDSQLKDMRETIQKLEKQLKLKNVFLASLWEGLSVEEALAAGFDPEKNLSIGDQLYNKLVEVNLPKFALENVLKHLVNIDSSEIPNDISIEKFVARLAEVASAGLLAPSSSSQPGESSEISFDVLVDADNSSSYPKETFNTVEDRIYASFSTGEYEGDLIIAKWTNMEDEELVLFRRFLIDPEMDHNFVFLEKKEGWSAGEYKVEIYGLNSEIPLLSSGKFQVQP